MRILSKEFRLQDVTVMYFTALAALMVILVASYQAPSHVTVVEVPSTDSKPSDLSPPALPMPFRVLLDPLGRLQLAWNISYARQEVYMELKVAELKHGVVLGMSDRGELSDADLVLLWDSEQLNMSRIRTGLQRILMLRPDTPAPALPPDVQTLDVVSPGVVIPTQETTYWCSIHKLPENMPENHIVMGGFGIMEEMCVNYVHYYPRTQLELCKSHVDLDHLWVP